MKGFLLAVALLGGVVYLIHQSDPAEASGASYATANGVPMTVTADTFDHDVKHNEAPVLAYFWATW